MTYEIQEMFPEPVVKGLALQVGGETIAKAWPLLGRTDWRLALGEDNLHVDLGSGVHARRVLQWIGKQASPSPVVITGREGLALAKPGVTYRTDYNNGNQYRVDPEGEWYYNTPDSIAQGLDFKECPGRTPYRDAYPLVEMR